MGVQEMPSSPADRFKVRVMVTIERHNAQYGGGHTGDRMSITDEQELTLDSFLEVAGVLGRFHELGAQLRREQQDVGR